MSSPPFHEIPAPPESYSATTVLSRLMEGLGYRYYWATDGLTAEALAFRSDPSSRSIRETMDHIRDIVQMVEYSLTGDTYALPSPEIAEDFDVRGATLGMIQRISETLRGADPAQIDEWKIRFDMGGNPMEFPFWHTINGTMSDAIYHTGQVVANRRAAGLPVNPNMNVFLGQTSA
jgi:hypothetical protein